MNPVVLKFMLYPVVAGLTLAGLWYGLSKGVLLVVCKWAESKGLMQTLPVASRVLLDCQLPENLLFHISREGHLLTQFTDPVASLGVCDFGIDVMSHEDQTRFARHVLKEYGLLIANLNSESDESGQIDTKTIQKVRTILVKRLIALASEGVQLAADAIQAMIDGDAEEAAFYRAIKRGYA